MNTKQLPAIIMLTAGVIATIISIIQGIDKPLEVILVVLVLFYIIGNIVKFIINKVMVVKTKDKVEDDTLEENAEGMQEDNM